MKIKIIDTVEHDGERLELGKQLDLPERAAQALIDAGGAERAGKTKADGGVQDGTEAEQK